MKQYAVIMLILTLFLVTCKKEKKFADPEYIFSKWSRAIELLNYPEYAVCEAYPKSEGVFREIYRDTYYSDLMVVDVEKLDENNIEKDHNGKKYIKRNVQFECTEVRRRDKKPVRVLRGDVDFIKFVEPDTNKRGWLMWNRKIIRIDR